MEKTFRLHAPRLLAALLAMAGALAPLPARAADTAAKTHPISDIFVDGLPAEPTPKPALTPPPEGLTRPVLQPPSATPEPATATETLPAANAQDAATSPSLVARAAAALALPLAPEAAASSTPTAPPAVAAVPTATPPPAKPQPAIASAASGKVDLNNASAAEIAALPGLDANRAGLIIAHRKSIGGFRQVEQLREVYGISEKTLLRVMPLVSVGPYAPPPTTAAPPAPAQLPTVRAPSPGATPAAPGTPAAAAATPLVPVHPSYVAPDTAALPALPESAATPTPTPGTLLRNHQTLTVPAGTTLIVPQQPTTGK